MRAEFLYCEFRRCNNVFCTSLRIFTKFSSTTIQQKHQFCLTEVFLQKVGFGVRKHSHGVGCFLHLGGRWESCQNVEVWPFLTFSTHRGLHYCHSGTVTPLQLVPVESSGLCFINRSTRESLSGLQRGEGGLRAPFVTIARYGIWQSINFFS